MSCNAPKQFMQDVNVSEIIDAPGLPRVQLYSDINSWMAERFVSWENVIQFQDKETGKIIGRFIVEFSEDSERYMTLNFDIRDDSFKMTMKEICKNLRVH